jgi:hypothetical protein
LNVETCCCGNVLRRDTRCRIIVHPCQCKKPGPVKRPSPRRDLPKQVTEQVYNERVAAGVPIVTDSERDAFRARGD